jgi:hypothetical protein
MRFDLLEVATEWAPGFRMVFVPAVVELGFCAFVWPAVGFGASTVGSFFIAGFASSAGESLFSTAVTVDLVPSIH